MSLKVAPSRVHGQGCFTTDDVAAGATVATGRVLCFTPDETEKLLGTKLKNYLFYVKDGPIPDGTPHSAVALGPISFCNHSAEANCSFSIDEELGEITLIANRDLAEGDELTIDYEDYAEQII